MTNSKSQNRDTALVLDTIKNNGQVSTSGIVGTGNGTKKDTIGKPTNTNAIIHTAPDQAKIDSIKNAKQKIKDNPK